MRDLKPDDSPPSAHACPLDRVGDEPEAVTIDDESGDRRFDNPAFSVRCRGDLVELNVSTDAPAS